jgi:hypothetical protein
MPTYTDIIATEIAEGWSYGTVGFLHDGREMWQADAHKDGKRCVCHAETLLTAMMELRGMISKQGGE